MENLSIVGNTNIFSRVLLKNDLVADMKIPFGKSVMKGGHEAEHIVKVPKGTRIIRVTGAYNSTGELDLVVAYPDSGSGKEGWEYWEFTFFPVIPKSEWVHISFNGGLYVAQTEYGVIALTGVSPATDKN